MKEEEIPDLNIFMMCEQLNPAAQRPLPAGYHIRYCRPDELDIWKTMHFDQSHDQKAYFPYMTNYFDKVYAPHGDLFFRTCLFVCDQADTPIATGFMWRAHNKIMTIHWVKVIKSYEGQGIGRALLTHMMNSITAVDYPVYLHTQPSSFRAIKLYADFGFHLLSAPQIGTQTNHLAESLPILETFMPTEFFQSLHTKPAPPSLLAALQNVQSNHF